MAIYLEQNERDLIKSKLQPDVDGKKGKWWWAKNVIDKLLSDEKRLEEISICNHTFGEYKGRKECCTSCGASDINMGESWTLIKNKVKK